MNATTRPDAPLVGIIANPVSARDIRRVIANAGSLQIADRVAIVMRLLSSLRSCGVERVLMMPDRAGIRAMLLRNLARERTQRDDHAQVEFLDMPVTSTVDDTQHAARLMHEAGVRALIVLGATARIAPWSRPARPCRSPGSPPAPTTPSPRCVNPRSRRSRWGST